MNRDESDGGVRGPSAAGIHVWVVDLDATRPAAEDGVTASERARAARLRNPSLRRRWLAARGWVRYLLSAYAGVPPEDLRLPTRVGEKPGPLTHGDGTVLHFNHAHSHRLLAVAVARFPVGIDVEALDRPLDLGSVERLAGRILAPPERTRWRRIAPAARRNALLEAWTDKEAALKALGTGLRVPPRRVRVERVGARGRSVAQIESETVCPRIWHLVRFWLPGYVGSVAASTPDADIRIFRPGHPLAS